MDWCECLESDQWRSGDEVLLKYQYISDFFIAFAYFSIPLELIYFLQKSAFFPYRWVLMQFCAFIVLCGATHFIHLWTFYSHSRTLAILLTLAKLSTAFVSCATALMLVHIIPDLLTLKTRELFLKQRAEDLDREMGLIIKQEETARHVRMLTHEIRSTLDRDTILKTTLIELGKTLDLEECVLWMPSTSTSTSTLSLSHSLHNLIPFGSTLPINLPIINHLFNSAEAIRIPHNCPLARITTTTPVPVPVPVPVPPQVVAVRVPLLHLSDFQFDNSPHKTYAIMVLILPLNGLRKWRDHELELVTVVADQVAVALSHAAILEESMRAREQLMDQNLALKLARQEAEMAIDARNDFLAVMNHEMTTPMHAVMSLSSLLLETQLTPDQRTIIETILKSSNLVAALVNEVLDLSRLEDGTLQLEYEVFNLHGLLREVVRLINPIASVKNTSMSLNCGHGLPAYGIGDEKRLMQVMLNIVGNAVKFTKGGHVSVEASILSPEYLQEWQTPDFCPTFTHGLFYLLVQVKDSGSGIKQQDIPHIFTKFSANSNGTGLGLAICKRFVNLMGGHIWIESGGLGKGTTVAFLVKLRDCNHPNDARAHQGSAQHRQLETRLHLQ